MQPNVGRASRTARLRAHQGPVNLLALDHGMSLGWTDSQDPPAVIAEQCYRNGLNGAVCHAGIIGRVRNNSDMPVFLQLHGSTPLDPVKKQLLSPTAAVRADCVGVAVEYQVASASKSLGNTARAIDGAQRLGLLVLVMANYPSDDYELAAKAIVGATQLGADYIKLGLPTNPPARKEQLKLRQVIADGPPVLLAGGDSKDSIELKLNVAHNLGMRGSCIGRHYFEEGNRKKTILAVKSAFTGH